MPKIALATSASVTSTHSFTVSCRFISHDASCPQADRVELALPVSRCSLRDRTYPSKMHCAPGLPLPPTPRADAAAPRAAAGEPAAEPAAGVTTTARLAIGWNRLSET